MVSSTGRIVILFFAIGPAFSESTDPVFQPWPAKAMEKDKSSRAESKAGRADLDGTAREDSSTRKVVTDLSFKLDLVEGEAALVFAHLREALAEVLAAPEFDGGISDG